MKILLRLSLFLLVLAALNACKNEPKPGKIESLACNNLSPSRALFSGVAVADSTLLSVNYTGGNGGFFPAITVSSSGVTGLSLLLDAGDFEEGNGILLFRISGTASSDGVALFALNIGGQSCIISLNVLRPAGTLTNLRCGDFQLSNPIFTGTSIAFGTTLSVPYSGANGGVLQNLSITSTGVSGITANLSGGNLNNGEGVLVFNLSGSPMSEGAALFTVNIGGQACVISIPVTRPQALLSNIRCDIAQVNNTLIAGLPVPAGTILTIPYLGGNAGVFAAQAISSTGVSGVTATLATGSLVNGEGVLSFQLSGTPAQSGTLLFLVSLGGIACNVLLPVGLAPGCGAFVAPGVWKAFHCYNLGSASNSVDPLTPSWQINGGYWQWGKKTEAAVGPTGTAASQANGGAISGWSTSPAADNSWLDASKTVNDPCPAGYRVPSKAQWEGILANNQQSVVGTWASSNTNYSSGRFFGSRLFLPSSGDRSFSNGALLWRDDGFYWSSSGATSNQAWILFFDDLSSGMFAERRISGFSIRCIEE